MSQRKDRKERVCRTCQAHIWGTAVDLKVHAETCARLKAIGLMLPGIIAPGSSGR